MPTAIVAKTTQIVLLLDLHVNGFSICCFISSVWGHETGQKESFMVFSQHLRESSLHHQVYLETI